MTKENRNITNKHIAAISVLLAVLLIGAAILIGSRLFSKSAKTTVSAEPVKLLVTTDLHYEAWPLASEDPGKESTVRYGGLAVSYEVDLLAAFREQIRDEDAAVLILTGDLVQQGDTESLCSLADILRQIEADGTKVLLLPGNHDLRGADDEAIALYRDTLAEFGFDEAISSDANSLSYVAEITPDLRVLMLDTITNPKSLTEGSPDDPGTTLGWICEQLRQAQADGVRMITATHENLLDHNSSLDNFRIVAADEVAALCESYGVITNVCGDFHVQNIREENGLVDIAQQPLSAYPNAYGVIELTGRNFSYQAKEVDVEGWAAKNNLSNDILLHFTEYSRENFEQAMYDMTIYDTEDETLRQYLAKVNFAFLTGQMDALEWDEELTERWKEEAPDSAGAYLESLRIDLGKNYRTFEHLDSSS